MNFLKFDVLIIYVKVDRKNFAQYIKPRISSTLILYLAFQQKNL